MARFLDELQQDPSLAGYSSRQKRKGRLPWESRPRILLVAGAASAALVDDFLGAAVAGADYLLVGDAALVDDFQGVGRNAVGLDLRIDLGFQFLTGLGGECAARHGKQADCQHQLLHEHIPSLHG
ncbi:hypothetical protein NCGM1900_0037 [Pseudomonas aeruginosa]|nr:hypothetical protein NCGM1900_0037 [Pseudomonas aeruginosa]BAP48042.1 hypothetical protein NCGM1984_0037 [Pseudomonas aeruginosa]